MGLLTGRATFLRFQVVGPKIRSFTEEHVERLSSHAAGKSRIASADGVDTGWTAGDHALDTDFTLEKNIVNECLAFSMRIDADKVPGDLLQAYTAIELKALSANNPSGFASSKQKREAKEAARERIEEEAKDGRFRKRTIIPCLWDSKTGELLFGTSSYSQLDRFSSLFRQTFGCGIEAITAGRRAFQLAELHDQTRQVDSATLGQFTPDTPPDAAWIADESSRDFLGNEFLLWLWHYLDKIDDTITLDDKSDVAVMIARSLVVDCPRGQTGTDAFRTEGPSRLPEAKRALQAGKLPRKAGLTVVRHDQQYEFTFTAEPFGISTAKLPAMPDDVTDARARLETRVDQIRSLIETIDLLYAAFLQNRLSSSWAADGVTIAKWLTPKSEAKAA